MSEVENTRLPDLQFESRENENLAKLVRSSHQILLGEIEDIRGCVEENERAIEENGDEIEKIKEFQDQTRGRRKKSKRIEESSYHWGRLAAEIIMAFVTIMSLLAASGAI